MLRNFRHAPLGVRWTIGDVILWQLPHAIKRWLRDCDPLGRVIARRCRAGARWFLGTVRPEPRKWA
jgi:hypothetical protein